MLGCPFQLQPCPPFNFSLDHLQLSMVFQNFVKKLQRVVLVYIQTRPPRLSTVLLTLKEAPSYPIPLYDFAFLFLSSWLLTFSSPWESAL